MKKHLILAIALIIMIGTTAYAQDISVYIDNKNIQLEIQPHIKNDTAYIPVRFIADELGSDVKWEAPNVIITNDYYKTVCTIGNKTAYKNGIPISLSEAPFIYNDYTFISSQGISDLLDCDVDYQETDNKITINKRDIIERKMKKLGVMDYCVAEDWIYYVTLGDNEGIHKMALNGSQDTIICPLPKIDINGSTAVSSELKNDCIIFKFQQLCQYDENGELQAPKPASYYKLNLANNTLTEYMEY